MKIKLDFAKAFSYMIKDPKFGQTLLIMSLLVITIPFLIPIPILMGYSIAIIRNFQAGKAELPIFELEAMLKDGLYPLIPLFVITFAMGLIFVPTSWIFGILFRRVWILQFTTQQGVNVIQGLIVSLASMSIYAIYAKAGTINALIKWENYRYFLEKNLTSLIIGSLVFSFASGVLGVLGLLVLCIGIIPALAYANLVHAGIVGQFDVTGITK